MAKKNKLDSSRLNATITSCGVLLAFQVAYFTEWNFAGSILEQEFVIKDPVLFEMKTWVKAWETFTLLLILSSIGIELWVLFNLTKRKVRRSDYDLIRTWLIRGVGLFFIVIGLNTLMGMWVFETEEPKSKCVNICGNEQV